jgi:four helix bundle protein
MNYKEWGLTVPDCMRGDPLWRVEAYRLAVFVGEIGWPDVTRLMHDARTIKLSGQLYEALGSISANVAEGYSRGSNKDRARFYEYALGSARESRDWYYKGRHVLTEKVALHRMDLLTQITRLLLVMVPDERGRRISEEQAPYITTPDDES